MAHVFSSSPPTAHCPPRDTSGSTSGWCGGATQAQALPFLRCQARSSCSRESVITSSSSQKTFHHISNGFHLTPSASFDKKLISFLGKLNFTQIIFTCFILILRCLKLMRHSPVPCVDYAALLPPVFRHGECHIIAHPCPNLVAIQVSPTFNVMFHGK